MTTQPIILNSIDEAIEQFRSGGFVIVVDDENRENEGDFIIAAEHVTPEKVNFMISEGRGELYPRLLRALQPARAGDAG